MIEETRYILPLREGAYASLTARFPLTEEEWQQMMNILEVMKKGLVVKSEPTTERKNRQ